MTGFLRDLRLAFRNIARRPGFAAAAVVTLALGIGANSALFSVVNGVLLRPLPYGSPDTLLMVWETGAEGEEHGGVSGPNFADWRESTDSLSGLAVFDDKSMILTGGGQPDQVFGTTASGSFFEVLDTPAALGRTFRATDEEEGEARVVVISDGLWKRRFGGDSEVVGTSLGIDDSPYLVLGVMPADFRDPLNPQVDLWVPLGFDPRVVPRGVHWLTAIGRLAPDATLDRAQAEMDAVAARLAEEHPDSNAGRGVALVPIHEELVGKVRPTLLILLGAVGLVLLIACTNVAILLLVDAAARMKESAVSVALGASRSTLIRQVLIKGAVLGALGSALGVLIAFAGVRLLLALEESGLPRTEAVRIDGSVLTFTLVVGLLTGLLAGTAPAIRLWRRGLGKVIKEAGGRAGGHSDRTHGLLVIAETALALILLVGAGLLLRSFWALQQVDPGFEPENVLTAEVALSETRYPESEQQAAFMAELLDRVDALPGVEVAAAVSHVPLRGENVTSIFLPGQTVDPNRQAPTANFRIVAGEYFSALGIPVRRGRSFDPRDHPEGELVVIVDEAMAQRFWPGGEAVGQRVGFRGPEGPWLTVVGVVGTIRVSGFDEESTGTIYTPFLQRPRRSMTLALRTASDPLTLADPVRQTVWQLDADQPVHDVRTMEDYVYESLARPRFNAMVLTLFAAISLLLAALGIYSVLAYSVAQRRHEIGVRIALGARPSRLVSMVVGRAMRLVGAGLLIGIVGAVALSRLLSGLLYDVAPIDPLTYIAICAILLLTALAATLLPSRRAVAVDPLTALRAE